MWSHFTFLPLFPLKTIYETIYKTNMASLEGWSFLSRSFTVMDKLILFMFYVLSSCLFVFYKTWNMFKYV